MRHGTVSCLIFLVALAGCPGGGGSLGDPCDNHGNCESALQCVDHVCVARCQRAPECGDGFSCGGDGLCVEASGQPGDACTSEVQCSPGLTCRIDEPDGAGHLLASCSEQIAGRPPGSTCSDDGDCHAGACELGHCVDLCSDTRDCGTGQSCMTIPRVAPPANGAMFQGCLPSKGDVVWTIPMSAPTASVLFPVPSLAYSAQLVFTVDDPAQRVGAQLLTAPDNQLLYQKPCDPAPGPICTVEQSTQQYFQNLVRHIPEPAQSVLALPSTPAAPLQTGAYHVKVSSYRPNGTVGSAIPHVTAVVRMDAAVILDLHFYFLDLDSHPCEAELGNTRLDASSANAATFFQNDYIGELRNIFAHGGIALGAISYQDVLDHPDLDGLDVIDSGSLLSLGEHATGVNVFFVRTLSPVGLQAVAPNPGPAGLANTRQSGIVIGVDTLCYRSWQQLARLTAHELARYMGLYHNVELALDSNQQPWRDQIPDSDDSSTNLMFYSEFGGSDLSPGQRDILTRSGVLR
jgi:hypothetical protein